MTGRLPKVVSMGSVKEEANGKKILEDLSSGY